ncbi:XRE family transcriptional regulator [Prauserella shujinwangii]|uniref:XRE family transcriptional regulator n=1 Tax=Prauserella shujinwangii TaxID=1453103 RepID=A0A2T0LVE6_9PSEU|nr:XRE family transcriptional regulator [Prauserella shujinwangii]PRX47796.1 XRE family transcriptional regulator [Prauserella shujinwangii]
MSDTETLARLARNIRAQRTRRQWTLDALAARAGLSKGVVVAVEQGRGNPNLATLIRISDALGVSLTALLEGGEEPAVRVTDRTSLLWEGPSGGTGRLLDGTDSPTPVELWHWRLEPGERHDSEPHAAGTRELLHVYTGELTLTVGGQEVVVPSGASARMTADEPHAYANAGRVAAEFVGVVVPPSS